MEEFRFVLPPGFRPPAAPLGAPTQTGPIHSGRYFKMKSVKRSPGRNERSKKLVWLISALPSSAILRCGLAAILCVLIFTSFAPERTTHSQRNTPDYKNPSLPIDKRVADLVACMTLEEKVA